MAVPDRRERGPAGPAAAALRARSRPRPRHGRRRLRDGDVALRQRRRGALGSGPRQDRSPMDRPAPRLDRVARASGGTAAAARPGPLACMKEIPGVKEESMKSFHRHWTARLALALGLLAAPSAAQAPGARHPHPPPPIESQLKMLEPPQRPPAAALAAPPPGAPGWTPLP